MESPLPDVVQPSDAMRRFFVPPRSIQGGRATLPESESHHITAVLRLEPGSAIELFDGTGAVYRGSIETLARQGVTVRILSRCALPGDTGLQIILVQCLLKGKKMDFLVQKATEMGVHSLQPLRSRYSEGLGQPPRQLDRWNRIMLEACKQCRRERPMLIAEPVAFDAFTVAGAGPRIMFWEGETDISLKQDHLTPPSPVWLMLGPEGGFDPREIDLARNLGFRTVSLGRYVLRAETAALAAVAIVQYLLGGFDASPRLC